MLCWRNLSQQIWRGSKTVSRSTKSLDLFKKIRFLPENYMQRMRDSIIFGRGMTCYGCIAHSPTARWKKKLITEIWTGLGKTQWSAIPMRKLIAGATLHMDLGSSSSSWNCCSSAIKLCVRCIGIDFGSMRISVLEEMVTQSLMDLDWQRDRSERWIHHLSTDGFMFEEVVDNKRWKQNRTRFASVLQDPKHMKSIVHLLIMRWLVKS